jgi:glycine cleavage system H lipoate-binding protein
MVALMFILALLAVLGIQAIWSRGKTRSRARVAAPREEPEPTVAAARPTAPPFRMPAGVLFSPAHSWLILQETGGFAVGIDDLARSLIGKVDEIVSLRSGEHVNAGDEIVELRRGRRRMALTAPVAGVVEDVNARYPGHNVPKSDDSLSNEWICRIRPDNTESVFGDMRIGNAATEWFDREIDRVKVLLATLRPHNGLVGQTAQDGGAPVWGLSDQLSDEEWRMVQKKFLL